MIYYEILFIIIAYLIGSIPFALIIGKLFYKTDVREFGSKNLGATNTLRVLGKKAGFSVFFLDFLKGGILIALFKFSILDKGLLPHFHYIYLGIPIIIGHLFPIFANFKGGKGVASTAGIVFFYSPIHFLISIIVFIIVFLISKFVSLSSICAIITLLITSSLIKPLFENSININFIIFSAIMVITLIIDHRANIKRIIKGKESKITFK